MSTFPVTKPAMRWSGEINDRHGQPIANDFDYFSTPTDPKFTFSFQYWKDKISDARDSSYYMIAPEGKNAPALWVAYEK